MASVIDALIVSLNLDAKGFDAGQKKMVKDLRILGDETDKTTARMEESGKQAAQFFGQLRNQAMGLFGAFTAGKGAAAFASYFTNTNSAIGRMSANLGLSTEQLSAWQGAGKRLGATAEDITGAFKNTSAQITALYAKGEWSDQLTSLSMAFAKAGMGGEFNKFIQQATTAEERMFLMSKAFSRLSPQERQLWGAAAGYSEEFINSISVGPEKLRAILEEQRKSAALTQGQAEAAAKLQDHWQRLDATMTQIGNRIMEELTPSLLEGIRSLQNMAEWWQKNESQLGLFFEKWEKYHPGTMKWFSDMNAEMEELAGWFEKNSEELNRLTDGLYRLTSDDLLKGIEDLAKKLAKEVFPTLNEGSGESAGVAPSAEFLDKAKKEFASTWGATANTQPAQAQLTKADVAARRDQAISYFMAHGLTRDQAIGFTANLQKESTFNDTAVNGSHYSVAQWSPERQALFKENFGKDIRNSTYEDQLAFIVWEWKNTERSAYENIRKTGSIAQSASVSSRNYFRPGTAIWEKHQEAEDRARIAATIAQMPSGAALAAERYAPPPTAPAPASQTTVSIGHITVNSQAADAAGIARDIRDGLNQHLTANAQTGLC